MDKTIVKPQGIREEIRLDVGEELFIQLRKKAIEDNLFNKYSINIYFMY